MPSTLLRDIAAIKMLRQKHPQKSIGFVATMGNLHIGHASLLKHARAENDITVLSLFINPTQFNDSNDYQRYPRTLAQDQQIADENQVDYLFIPNAEDLYADNYHYKICEDNVTRKMEGKFRSGHFEGVLTIVMKLLQIVQPTRAYFGEKDFQQYQLIQGMTQAFFLNSDIVLCPTVRETSGLAYSSRNGLLSPRQKQQAAHFYHALANSKDCQTAAKKLQQLGFRVEYIEDHEQRRYGAVYLDHVRLIDNVALTHVG